MQNFKRGNRWMTLEQAQEYDRLERSGELPKEEKHASFDVEKPKHIAPVERLDADTLERDRLVKLGKQNVYGESLEKNPEGAVVPQFVVDPSVKPNAPVDPSTLPADVTIGKDDKPKTGTVKTASPTSKTTDPDKFDLL